MIGRTRPPILQRQPRADGRVLGGRRWLLAAAALCTVAIAEPPPAAGTTHPPPPVPHESQPQGVPDDEFIEFLGADDVGDETWWEFLKKAPPRRENSHAAPTQESKQ
jgi:hypothetical protein